MRTRFPQLGTNPEVGIFGPHQPSNLTIQKHTTTIKSATKEQKQTERREAAEREAAEREGGGAHPAKNTGTNCQLPRAMGPRNNETWTVESQDAKRALAADKYDDCLACRVTGMHGVFPLIFPDR